MLIVLLPAAKQVAARLVMVGTAGVTSIAALLNAAEVEPLFQITSMLPLNVPGLVGGAAFNVNVTAVALLLVIALLLVREATVCEKPLRSKVPVVTVRVRVPNAAVGLIVS